MNIKGKTVTYPFVIKTQDIGVPVQRGNTVPQADDDHGHHWNKPDSQLVRQQEFFRQNPHLERY